MWVGRKRVIHSLSPFLFLSFCLSLSPFLYSLFSFSSPLSLSLSLALFFSPSPPPLPPPLSSLQSSEGLQVLTWTDTLWTGATL